MRLSVAANYDLDAVSELAGCPVEEVYGKLPGDAIGGGRPAYMSRPLDWDRLAQYVRALDTHGIAFNYLLNSSCQGNREWGRRWQRRFTRLMGRLEQIGVRHVTVSTPYLLEAVKSRWPAFSVRVGIFAQVDTASRARFWEDLGADTITLESFSINRNLGRLKDIRAAVSCRLQLIANHVCLPNCAMQPYHQNGFAHSSHGSDRLFIDYCVLRCARKRLEDPALFLKSAWIRPEDVAMYECLGIDSLKLLERDMPSGALLRRVKAYTAQESSGNMADLLLSYGFRETIPRPRFWSLKHFVKPWDVSPKRLLPLLRLARHQGMLFALQSSPVTIDSAALPTDFLDVVANCPGATGRGCGTCRRCEDMAEQAVHIDESFRQKALEQFQSVQSDINNGDLWNV